MDTVVLPIARSAVEKVQAIIRESFDAGVARNTAMGLVEAGSWPWLLCEGRWDITGVQDGPEGARITLTRVEGI